MQRRTRLILVNRVLLVLVMAALVAGLLFEQWRIVLRYAMLL